MNTCIDVVFGLSYVTIHEVYHSWDRMLVALPEISIITARFGHTHLGHGIPKSHAHNEATTHTDRQLKFGSNHHLWYKRSVVETPLKRASKVISKEEDKKPEIRHVRSSLHTNGYQEWMFKTKAKKKDGKPNNTTSANPRAPSIGLQPHNLTPIFQQQCIGMFHNFPYTLLLWAQALRLYMIFACAP